DIWNRNDEVKVDREGRGHEMVRAEARAVRARLGDVCAVWQPHVVQRVAVGIRDVGSGNLNLTGDVAQNIQEAFRASWRTTTDSGRGNMGTSERGASDAVLRSPGEVVAAGECGREVIDGSRIELCRVAIVPIVGPIDIEDMGVANHPATEGQGYQE